MITASALVAHGVGDYLFQSHWAAQEKTKAHLPAAIHAATYALAFLPLTRSPWRLAAIAGTHFLIDRYRLARYVVWAKNQMAPAAYRPREVTATGYPADTPPWLAVWLLILADNICHCLINAVVLSWRRTT
jgi:hypothetical protein